MNDTVSELYNEQLEKLDNEYNKLSVVEKKGFHFKYNFKGLFLSDYDYNDFFAPPLEGDEEKVKEEKGLKVLTPNKLLTRSPVLLV